MQILTESSRACAKDIDVYVMKMTLISDKHLRVS